MTLVLLFGAGVLGYIVYKKMTAAPAANPNTFLVPSLTTPPSQWQSIPTNTSGNVPAPAVSPGDGDVPNPTPDDGGGDDSGGESAFSTTAGDEVDFGG